MDNFQDFLLALEDGNITGYESAVAWNYSENDIEIPESVTESVNEMFEIADLTSASILGWFTGQKHRQSNNEKIHNVRNPTHSICFPLVGACAMKVTFPVSHRKTYNDFKNVFTLAFYRRQAFGKP